ncbi:hypothetical protein TUBRATIS_13070 [Tubulinosema ratisbonensis]|uniref:Uncharacterized protein n=1 Tax=Tubulinosema ratisbonensis TaxID=291195 RepID=A0A437AM74_9MICR|nr:hypothetical protein TUBRATIS_13070 [Tubulinosema ratisbonensis]
MIFLTLFGIFMCYSLGIFMKRNNTQLIGGMYSIEDDNKQQLMPILENKRVKRGFFRRKVSNSNAINTPKITDLPEITTLSYTTTTFLTETSTFEGVRLSEEAKSYNFSLTNETLKTFSSDFILYLKVIPSFFNSTHFQDFLHNEYEEIISTGRLNNKSIEEFKNNVFKEAKELEDFYENQKRILVQLVKNIEETQGKINKYNDNGLNTLLYSGKDYYKRESHYIYDLFEREVDCLREIDDRIAGAASNMASTHIWIKNMMNFFLEDNMYRVNRKLKNKIFEFVKNSRIRENYPQIIPPNIYLKLKKHSKIQDIDTDSNVNREEIKEYQHKFDAYNREVINLCRSISSTILHYESADNPIECNLNQAINGNDGINQDD